MTRKNIGRSALYLSLTMVLAACGGGGGSDSSDPVDGGNDSGIIGGGGNDGGVGGGGDGSISLDPNGYSTRQASLSQATDVEAAMQLRHDALEVIDLIDDIEATIYNWYETEPTGSFTRACENEEGVVEATILGNSESWTFTNCEVGTLNYGPVLLNGTYLYVESKIENGERSSDIFKISGTLLDSGDELKIQGQVDWTDRYRVQGDETSLQFGALEFLLGDRYVAASNLTSKTVRGDESMFYALSGKLIGSAIDGYVTVSTPTQLRAPIGSQCREEGVVRIEGEGFAEIRYGTSTGTSDWALIEVNGNRGKALTCAEAWDMF